MKGGAGNPSTSPRSFGLHDGGGLWIEWEDGHGSELPGSALRTACPCALCRDRREKGLGPTGPESSFSVAGASPTGRYALRIAFRDGHSDGIFPHRLLRDLCTCLSCRLQRSEA